MTTVNVAARVAQLTPPRCSFTGLAPDGITTARVTDLRVAGGVIVAGWLTLFDRVTGTVHEGYVRERPAYRAMFPLRFSDDGRFLFYLDARGLAILDRAVRRWIRLVPSVEPAGMLVLDDDGQVDGDEAVLAATRFEAHGREHVGLAALAAAGEPSPRVPGLFARFLARGSAAAPDSR